ncbi:MAG: glycine--tRNA ligase [Planctomycetia bacterium]|nr:glycine--tRNA ligase [Planctomycetia bacterium]
MAKKIDMAKFAKFCKDMGFIYQSSEIYGGINGFWDYGPLGVELKRNIKEAWWQDMVRNPPPGPDGQEIRMVGLDCSIIMNPKVWVASGHVGAFTDPTRKCSKCGKFTRADHLWAILAECEWMNSLIQEFTPITGTYDTPRLMKWAKGKGQRLAPNLALVRNPEVTLSWLATRVNGQPDAPPTLQEFTQYIATEQLHQTGLQDPCPACGAPLGEAKQVSLMFESHAGLEQTEDTKVYLRPETAQGIFANYKNVLDSSRLKLPFGIAQVGKAFRNEVTPRNYTFRSREFEQMEIEFFCHPNESMKWYEYWRDLRKKWYTTLGLSSENLVPREQGKEELAFYSKGTTDIEYMFPFSDEPQELEGVAHRGDYDLTQHAKHSGKDLSYFDEEGWNNLLQERLAPFANDKAKREEEKKKLEKEEKAKFQFVPHVIEPSAGADRFTLAVLCEAYCEDTAPDAKGNPETRTVMRFHPRLAPIKAAIFPLVNKDGMDDRAKELYRALKPHFNVVYDQSGAIGRRYRRQDEAGTPFCITIDGDTMKDGTVTVRARDTLKQDRIPMTEVRAFIEKALTPG